MSAAYYLVAAFIGLAGVYTARRCRLAPTQALRAFTATLFLVAAAFVVLANATRPLIDNLTNVDALGRWAGNSLTLAAGAGLYIVLACFARSPDDPPMRTRPHTIAVVAASATMAVLVLGTPDHDDFVDVYATRLNVTAYLLIYLSGLGVIMGGALASGARYAARTHGWMRTGMAMVATGGAFGVAYSLYKTAVVIARYTGNQLGTESIVGPALGLVSALLIAIGSTLGSWAPSLAAAAQRALRYRRLEKLHTALAEAFPEIQLDIEVSDRRYRLDRRIVEIRDGQLRLRPWSDPLHAALLARNADHDPAVVEALVITAALRARADGTPPSPLHPDQPGHALEQPADIEAETAHLTRVARFFSNPPANVQLFETTESSP